MIQKRIVRFCHEIVDTRITNLKKCEIHKEIEFLQ